MSLDELRAQAEAEETKVTEEPDTEVEEPEQPEEPEAEQEETEEPEAEEAEESEEFELELDGEPEPGQQKPSPEEALVYKLTKQKQKTREYKSELEELKAEIAALKSGQVAPQPQEEVKQTRHEYPPVPLLYENGVDTPDQYQRAYQKWVADCKEIDQRNAEASRQKSEYTRQMEEMTLNMAKRVSKFATEHKMSGDYVANAVERARQEVEDATGIEGSLAYMLDAVGEGSEKVALWIGTEKGARDLELIKDLLAKDKSGLKAIAHMTRIAARKPAQKRTSKAPEPDQPLRGDGSSKSARKLQEEYDKASSKMDMGKMRELKRKAESIGVKLN